MGGAPALYPFDACGMVQAAYQQASLLLGVSLQAVYKELNRLEPGIPADMVQPATQQIGPVIAAMGATRAPWVEGDWTQILVGNHLAATEQCVARAASSA